MVGEEIKQVEKEIAEAGAPDNKVVNNKSAKKANKEYDKLITKKISGPKAKQLRAGKANNKDKKVSQKKLKSVEELKELAGTKKTIMIASIKNLPASQFQEISKKLRGKAVIKVPKKSISIRVIESLEGEEIKKIKEKIDSDIAIIFSDLDSFELAAELINSKSSAKAKAGQEAPDDIVVEEGPTDLIPGPAVSELGNLGIQISIENGKINIRKSKTIVKKGVKISEGAADVMNKLGIKPFLVGFEPIASFDVKEKKLYVGIKIDTKGTIDELKNAFGKALPFAVEIEYPCDETIRFIINKAGMHEKALDKIIGGEKAEAGVSVNNEVINTETTNNAEPIIKEKELIEKENSEPTGEANAQPENKVEEEK